AGSALLLALSVAGLLRGGTLVDNNSVRGGLEARRVADLVATEVAGRAQGSGGSSFILIFGSRDLTVRGARFQAALEAAVAPLGSDGRVAGVDTPYSVPGATTAQSGWVSRDGHQVLVSVTLRDPVNVARGYYDDLRHEVRSDVLNVQGTGAVPINQAF